MATHPQSYLNSCGAATLLCAANELGVQQIPFSDVYTLWQANPRQLQVNQTCETMLYQVTSTSAVGNNPQNWGYSLPSGVATCARLLGLRVRVMAYKTWTVRGLKLAYNAELDRLRAMNMLVEHGTSKSTFRPNPRQKELKVLLGRGRGNFGALHYVMVRSDLTVMEPGTGQDYSGIAAAKTAVGMHGTGLSVFLQA